MKDKTVLIAMELGGNSGHLNRAFPIAENLKSKGYRVVIATTDIRAATMMNTGGFQLVQAPVNSVILPRPDRPLLNHAEILRAVGYADTKMLAGLLNGWLSIIDMVNPALVMVDYAPTASLAARMRGRKTLAIAAGFNAPPIGQSPMPSFVHIDNKPIPKDQLMPFDDAVLNVVNAVINPLGFSIKDVSWLFASDARIIANLPELDPWGARKEIYVGPIHAGRSLPFVDWNDESDESLRVFAYLRPNMRGFEGAIAALRATDAEIICTIPGITNQDVMRFSADRMRVFPYLISPHLLNKASAVFSYGGVGTVAESLLTGVPMVIAPDDQEKTLTAQRAVETGSAIMILNGKAEHYINAIETVLKNPEYRASAQKVAKKYANYDMSKSLEIISGIATDLIRQSLN